MGREIIDINRDWTFTTDKNDKKEIVCLPHTIELTPANSSGGLNYQGICSYEKDIDIECKDGKIFIEFEGAMGAAELWINEKLVARHFCGYTPFVADITDYAADGKNSFRVVLDNRDNEKFPPGKPQNELDFCYDGGLYRKAKLIYTDKLYISNPLIENEPAGGGIFIHCENISENHADICVKTHVRNDGKTARTVKVIQQLKNTEDAVIAEAVDEKTIGGSSAEYSFQKIGVENPTLWCMKKPYLYTLKTTIISGGRTVDEIITKTGIRTFEYTTDRGIVFNGEPMRISGANYHQTYPYIGNAVPESLLKRDILKLKGMGMDNIRSHYPFSSSFMEFCDSIGMTVIVSNVGWQFYKKGEFAEQTLQNMRDIVRWHRNNPSVILWEPVLNESEISFDEQRALCDAVHEEYPYAPCYTASDWGPSDVAYKDYDPKMLGKGLEKYGLVKPDNDEIKPKWIREYGDAPDNFVDQNAAWRTPRGWGDYAMLQAVERMIGRFDKTEGTYAEVYNNHSICGYGTWPGIEHNRGYHMNPCWGGYFDLFRIPKFAYYFMKSQCEPDIVGEVLFIANYWTENSPGDVTVYSNADEVRLYHNDELVGGQKPDDAAVKHPPFAFKDVRRKYKDRDRSCLVAEAIRDGEVVKRVKVMSPGVAKNLSLEADFCGIPLVADGADIVCVYCKVLDAEGNVVPVTADRHEILFKIEGEGKIIGNSEIGANPICPEGGIASVLIQSTKIAGKITLTAEPLRKQNGCGIEGMTLEITSIDEKQ